MSSVRHQECKGEEAGGLYSEYERQSVKALHQALYLSFLFGS